MNTPWKYVLPVVAVYVILIFIGIFHHEIWLDEAHHWLLARDSSSLGELIHNARYDGHPLLWNFLLFLVTRFTHDPFWMQALNAVIATTGVLLFLRYSPMKFYVSLLFVFSYFIFYEYSVISRNYALLFLVLVITAVIYPARNEKSILFCFALLLLACTHLFGCILAAVLIAGEFPVAFLSDEKRNWKTITPFIFLSLAIGAIVWMALPPADHFLYRYDTDSFFSFKRIGKAFSILWKGFFPMPDVSCTHPWNSNWLIDISKNAAVIPSALVWIIPYFILRTTKWRVIFYAAALLVAGFVFLSPLMVASRHCGVLFLLLMFCVWIETIEIGEQPGRDRKSSIGQFFLWAILIVQFAAGIILFQFDVREKFSASKDVADWIISNKMQQEFIVVSDHSTGPPIAAYLDRKLWYAENNDYGSFCKWNTNPFILSHDELLKKLIPVNDALSAGHGLLITNKALTAPEIDKAPALHLTPEKFFEISGTRSETYFIYRFSK